jgi:hypothetical protein
MVVNMNIPAFPQNNDRVVASLSIANSQGMTLRDYFASKIFSKVYEEHCNGAFRNGFEDGWRDDCAKEAYLMADAMLKARQE